MSDRVLLTSDNCLNDLPCQRNCSQIVTNILCQSPRVDYLLKSLMSRHVSKVNWTNMTHMMTLSKVNWNQDGAYDVTFRRSVGTKMAQMTSLSKVNWNQDGPCDVTFRRSIWTKLAKLCWPSSGINPIKNLKRILGVSLENYGTQVQTSEGMRGVCYQDFSPDNLQTCL